MKKLFSKKNLFYLSVALGFIYSGLSFLLIKTFETQFANLIEGYGIFFAVITIIFMLLVILSAPRLKELQNIAMSNPTKMYDMMFHLVYMTFLYTTMYVLLNGAIITALPASLLPILFTKTLIINIPFILIFIGIKIKNCNKKNILESLLIPLLFSAIMINKLTILDIVIFSLMFLTSKIKISKNISKIFNVLEIVALATTLIALLFFLTDGAWLLSSSACILILVISLMQISNIKSHFNNIKTKIGGIKYDT